MIDISSQNKILLLHPAIRSKATEFLIKSQSLGYPLRITSSLRTFEEQTKLYNQGRTTEGKIITNAKAGQSYHNYGLAFDVVPIENGQINWNSKNWDKIGQIGKSIGFEWGGDFKTIVDKPHFQKSFGKSTVILKRLYDKTGNYVNLDTDISLFTDDKKKSSIGIFFALILIILIIYKNK